MGKIMLNGKQYGVGGITDAEDVKYGNTTVDAALDQNASDISANATEINTLKSGLTDLKTATAPFTDVSQWKSNVDLNDYIISGFYPIGTNPTNAPTGWGILFVIGVRADTLEQLYFANGRVYIREYRNPNWTSWAQL